MKSIFMDREIVPTEQALKKALAGTFDTWEALEAFTKKSYVGAMEAWAFSGAKYGWSFRISDKMRVLLYLLPRDLFFKVAFVFGQKATDAILKSDVREDIKEELRNAKVYAEGRGIRIDVKDDSIVDDIKKLIMIKISNG